VLSMSQVLNQIGTYTGGAGTSITNLTQLGVEFTDQGTLTFDPTAIAGLSQTQISDALNFLGTPTSGFLQYATNALDGITDPTTGVIATESQALQNQVNTDQTQINNDQAQVTQLQATLQAQMATSDALIATLQQQNTFLQGLFQYATSNNPDVASAA
jgi:flagellar hook-associated protein 2